MKSCLDESVFYPQRVEPEGWTRRWEAQNFALFFVSLPPPHFLSSFSLLGPFCFSFASSFSHLMGRRGWQAIEVPQGWQCDPWSSPTVGSLAERPTAARWGPFSGRPTSQTSANLSSRTMAPGTFKGEPPMENARKQVSGLEPAIATMIASGMEENSPEVMTLRGSLVKAKRNARRPQLPCRSGFGAVDLLHH